MKDTLFILCALQFLALVLVWSARAAEAPANPRQPARPLPSGIRFDPDLVYAQIGDRELTLDLYWPETVVAPAPLIIWVHGGAWRGGNKNRPGPTLPFLDKGYAVASVGYRLSQEAIFPAQIQDCKAAVRWLRANAGRYNLNPERFGAWGSSAGGHLVALLGTAGNVSDWENVGEHRDVSSRVQAVCDWFGPTDFLRMDDVPGAIGHNAPNSPESQLIGAPIQENADKVARANPITYVTPDDPPFLIMHGTVDLTVLPNQSELLHRALQAKGVTATLLLIEGQGHGFRGAGPEVSKPPEDFFDRVLK